MEKILTGNHSLLKNLNSKGILKLIRNKAPISGSNLAKIMRLSAVHNILIKLDKKGLVLKMGTRDSTKLGGDGRHYGGFAAITVMSLAFNGK